MSADNRRPWRRCPSCGGTCHWHDTAWVCDQCGDEWDSEHDPKFEAPGVSQGVSSNTAAGSYGDSDTRNRTGGDQ